jgi:hypothetical protein
MRAATGRIYDAATAHAIFLCVDCDVDALISWSDGSKCDSSTTASCSADVYWATGLGRSVSACHYKHKPMCTGLIARCEMWCTALYEFVAAAVHTLVSAVCGAL